MKRPPLFAVSLSLLALSAFLSPGPVQAQVVENPPWHLLVEMGNTDLDYSTGDFRVDGDDLGFGLHAGTRFQDRFTAAIAYQDLGRMATTEDPDNGDPEEIRDTSVTAWMAYLEMDWRLFDFLYPSVGLGVGHWQADLPAGADVTDSDTVPVLRAGLGVAVAENSRLQLTAQHMGRLEANSVLLGLRFDF